MAVVTKKVFTVDRGTWLHAGTRAIDPYDRGLIKREGVKPETVASIPSGVLLDTNLGKGMMCCLGFVCNQLGVVKKWLSGIGMPETLIQNSVTNAHKLEGILVDAGENSSLAQAASVINDNDDITNLQREKQLIALFKKNGYTLKFTGTYPKIVNAKN